ncbi:MAG: manganese efflux pump MntP family protein [Lachnospiraceae bacterium]|nr:manganese efflux pump MntP family protein [Lachnospiraceae bacterium]MDY5741896.1 manganese efflux pump MntP family protein [Lachnospiraceae bacterium]
MRMYEIVLIAVGLAMDACSVAVGYGLCVKNKPLRQGLLTGLFFGVAQAVMPLLGYFLGTRFSHYVMSIDHWVAFILLGLIGFNMIREGLAPEEEESCQIAGFTVEYKKMFVMAVATSIDALAVGVTFAFLPVNIWLAAGSIGMVTFLLSLLGVLIGGVLGQHFKEKAVIAGGCVLIFLGAKILVEHLGILGA